MAPTDFVCVLCDEAKREEQARWVENERICHGCATESIAPLFRNALKHEFAYPPRWGSVSLDFGTFADVLEAGFARAWEKKKVEYGTPVEQRLYCGRRLCDSKGEDCGAFLGVKGEGFQICLRCSFFVCKKCGGGVSCATEDWDLHTCGEEAEKDPYADMTKGSDYQQCPGCKVGVVQRDGCNHMVCLCGMEFCYICGKDVKNVLLTHWEEEPCPRYGRLAAQRPVHYDQGIEQMIREGETHHIIRILTAFEDARHVEIAEHNRIRLAGRQRQPPNAVEHLIRLFENVEANLRARLTMLNNEHEPVNATRILEHFRLLDVSIMQDFDEAHERQEANTAARFAAMEQEFAAYFQLAANTDEHLRATAAPAFRARLAQEADA